MASYETKVAPDPNSSLKAVKKSLGGEEPDGMDPIMMAQMRRQAATFAKANRMPHYKADLEDMSGEDDMEPREGK